MKFKNIKNLDKMCCIRETKIDLNLAETEKRQIWKIRVTVIKVSPSIKISPRGPTKRCYERKY